MQSSFNILSIFPSCYVALCVSKARHRLRRESVSWWLETSLLKIPFLGRSSLPTSFVSFFIFYIFPYLFLKTMVCFSGCLMSSASLQKLFCEVCSALKCSFEEFVREKVVIPSYSSAIFSLRFKMICLDRFSFLTQHFCYQSFEFFVLLVVYFCFIIYLFQEFSLAVSIENSSVF